MRYQKIESQIWHDEKFIKLSHSQQLLFFYILTSPHNNLIGTYVLKPGYICEDLNVKSVKKDIDTLAKLGLIQYEHETGLIHIPNFFKHNPLTNPNQHKSAVKVWNRLPKSSLLTAIYEGLSEGLKQRLGKGLLKPETEEEAETETEPEPEIEVKDDKDIYGEFPSLNIEAWKDWLDYKKEIKSKYKTENGEKSKIAELINMTSGDLKLQAKLIKQAIDEEWKGIHPLKDDKGGNKKSGFKTQAERNKEAKEEYLNGIGKEIDITP